jgi:hypothetical protein
MPLRIHVSALLLFASTVWGLALVLGGITLPPGAFGPFSIVVGSLVFALSVFDVWLWRVPVLQGWFVKRPALYGTWRVTFHSDWVDPETNEGIPPKVGYMAVRQTYSSLSMKLMTDESTSSLVAEGLSVGSDGTFKVFAVYRNESRIAVRDRSPIHYGAFALDVQGSPASRMEGAYWTDRNTRGDMTLTDRNKKVIDGYGEADAQFRGNARGTRKRT